MIKIGNPEKIGRVYMTLTRPCPQRLGGRRRARGLGQVWVSGFGRVDAHIVGFRNAGITRVRIIAILHQIDL